MRYAIMFTLFILSSLASLNSMARTIHNGDYHYYHPVTLKAAQLSEAADRPLTDLSVMVAMDGTLRAIPFQFEEYDELGMVYLDGAAKEDLVGHADKLDGQDLLVFMYRDTQSERWPRDTPLKQGKIVKELTFQQSDGAQRYAYLVEGSPLRSSARYVNYEQDKGEVTGGNYFFKFKANNLALAEEYRVSGTADQPPQQAPNLLHDSLFELKTSVVFKFMRLTFNSKRNLKMKPVAALHGPVRVPVILKAQSTFFGVPVFTMYTQMNLYDHAINAPGIEVNKPRMKKLIKNLRRAARYLLEPEVVFQIDYKNFDGAQMQLERTSRQHAGYGIVDGQYNDYERAMQDTFLPGQWLWFHHPKQHWKILTTSAIPEEFLNLEGLNPQVIYEDQTTAPRPRVGFTLRGEKVALEELAKGFKLADQFFKDMKPYNLDGIFLAVIDGVDQGKSFEQIMQEQNLSAQTIQELFDIFQLKLDIEKIGKLVDMSASYKGSITLGEFLGKSGIQPDSAKAFMGMFQMQFDADRLIKDLPQYSHQLMQQLYQGYRDKIKNGVTVWTPVGDASINPSAFNKALYNPPRLQ